MSQRIMAKMADGTEIEAVAETVLYPNGSPKYRGFLLAGEPHGAWRWFRVDGSLMRTGEFDHGAQVGTWRTYDRSGRLVKETVFATRES